MATNPISTPLPADLPENWIAGQTVAPNGSDVGLAEQYGYNYQSQQINDAQTAINTISEAFENLYGNTDTVPVINGGTGATTVAAALANLGAQPGFNLLVNSRFKYNGRNQSVYTATGTAKYTVDGWRLRDNATLTLENNGVTVACTSDGVCELLQYLSINYSDLAGKTLTVSAKVGDTIYSASGAVPEVQPGQSTVIAQTTLANNFILSLYWSSISSVFFVSISNSSAKTGDSFTVSAAKLEIGSVSTLAADIAGAQDETLEQLRLDMYDLDPGRPAYVLTQNENLLGNWYFVGGGSQQGGGQFPINQQLKTNYTSLRCIDRYDLNGELIINSDSISVTFNSTSNYFLEYIEKDLVEQYAGNCVTVSALINGNLYCASGIIPSTTPSVATAIARVKIDDITELRISYSINKNYWNVVLAPIVATQKTYNLIALKLELGHRSTLAHLENGQWVLNDLPNYQQELAKCQRCFIPLISNQVPATMISSSNIYFFIPLPVTIRKIPTISGTPFAVANQSGQEQTGFTFSVTSIRANGVMVMAQKSGHGLTQASLNAGTLESPTFLDANL